ncbi:MAG: C25 family cysteine peptidase [Bacteroidales bacterium]
MKLNRFILLLISATIQGLVLNAQTATGPSRTINDSGLQGIEVSWQFDGITTHPVTVDGEVFQFIRMKDFTHTKEVGKPALPCYQELIAIPQGADMQVRIVQSSFIDMPVTHRVHPALQPATDTYGAPEPDFEIDEDFYGQDQFWPSEQVSLEGMHYWRELGFGVFVIHPVQYNPVQQIIRVYTELVFEVSFTGGTRFLDLNQHSEHWLGLVARPFLNGGSISKEISQKSSQLLNVPATPDYIIITHINYMAAAQQLAEWKQQMGHIVEIVDGTGMSSAAVETAVHSRYNAWTPKPDFLLIIGDHPDIPGQVINGSYGTYATDQYFVCTGPGNDFVADMAKGRISVSTATEANNVVNKIIQYEKNPPEDSLFYAKAVHAAYFQHLSNGYAERRFAQTAEEIRNYMVNIQGYDVTRIYYTESTVSPTNWNNSLYSAGEPIPLYLRKPTFPWTGNATQINTAINSGAFYIMHRDHGYESGWGDPAYSSTNVSALTNGNKTPIVMTINCLTGKYYYGECFSERFLRKYPGGAVGVFGHAEVSLSGYNDALAFGIFDAIWAAPGCIPVFTGSGGTTLVNPPAHPKIFTMGDVANHGLIRMTQTWGTHQYTNELFHYFGDPSMRIYTRKPVQITASHPATLQCGSDTTLAIFSTTSFSGMATLMVDGELVSTGTLSSGALILHFPQLSGTYAILTISDTNTIPYIDTIIITGGCPKSKFEHQAINYCLANPVTFSNLSTGTITGYAWNFGAGANPATATGPGPHVVSYATPGTKNVSLVVTGTANHSSTTTFVMDSLCKFTVPTSGSDLITNCTGMLFDDGGDQNYSNSTNGTVTITPSGASTVNLLFHSFNFEGGADYLKVYDGPNISSPLIGTFTGTSLPGTSGMISSTTGSITLQQTSNASNTFSGFSLTFQCAFPNSAPMANFIVSDSSVCLGEYSFTDLSFNGPGAWLWYFGDGNTSTQQNPQHQYLQNGVFDVALVTTNAFGSDSIMMHGLINVNMPTPPLAPSVTRCKAGTVTLTANAGGKINWFSVPAGGTSLATGATFTTPILQNTTSYYVENEIALPLKYAGKYNNTGDGAYLTYEHYLVFDAYKPFRITSVRVYAQAAGNRTIALRNSAGTTLLTTTINIPAGTSRITLNFDVPTGTNLRLVGTGSPNLYRNTSGLNYPYVIPGVLSIHSSSASSNPTGYYYYFYDWEIQEESCISPRVQVDAIISDSLLPVSQFVYTLNTNQVQFSNLSKDADTYLWNFGDGNYSTLEQPLHIYQVPSTYQAKLFAVNGCGTDSASEMISITTGVAELNHDKLVSVYPNPSKGHFTVEVDTYTAGDMDMRLFDAAGRQVGQFMLPCQSGSNRHRIDAGHLPSGVYTLRSEIAGAVQYDKLIFKP